MISPHKTNRGKAPNIKVNLGKNIVASITRFIKRNMVMFREFKSITLKNFILIWESKSKKQFFQGRETQMTQTSMPQLNFIKFFM